MPADSARKPDWEQHLELPVPALTRQLTSRLRSCGIESPQAEAEWLLAEVLNTGRSGLYLNPERRLTASEKRQLGDFVSRRSQREPLQYILGSCEFFGLELEVQSGVLIPRPETELLVERVIELAREAPVERIIDLGTGSGCIAVSLAKHLPEIQILAVELSEIACEVAGRNARRHGVQRQLEVRRLDYTNPEHTRQLGQFDIVVANPPYVLHSERDQLAEEIKRYEPGEALFTGGDGLAYYRHLLRFCRDHLGANGWIACEMASQRWQSTVLLFRASGLAQIEIIKDYADRHRHLIGQRTKEMRS